MMCQSLGISRMALPRSMTKTRLSGWACHWWFLGNEKCRWRQWAFLPDMVVWASCRELAAGLLLAELFG